MRISRKFHALFAVDAHTRTFATTHSKFVALWKSFAPTVHWMKGGAYKGVGFENDRSKSHLGTRKAEAKFKTQLLQGINKGKHQVHIAQRHKSIRQKWEKATYNPWYIQINATPPTLRTSQLKCGGGAKVSGLHNPNRLRVHKAGWTQMDCTTSTISGSTKWGGNKKGFIHVALKAGSTQDRRHHPYRLGVPRAGRKQNKLHTSCCLRVLERRRKRKSLHNPCCLGVLKAGQTENRLHSPCCLKDPTGWRKKNRLDNSHYLGLPRGERKQKCYITLPSWGP